ncbi:type IV secretory system conjugative DNA transfer family protein [Aliarcobacter cryaerophilus]|uniref:type IV secretory system conjugative DNA transfer family protein n=1 Tax=Aliarcobacter cryaerophilus TaxID=28198 RepID=UPI0021B22295|nr:type IV secretory system conjugative DNA transfer family protein [Aliarcobacter cryaerophilus]MCT7445065.1 type IV secretory system conjugative DNA transfer family protein [Aliarcobacter cryaerophilus]MCT7479658.1 type IV secretory system conjugative DNA transfer family protein [Aliarcobacter cryaerophilus]
MLATIGFIPSKIKNSSNKVKKEKELIVPKKYTHSCAVGQTGCGKTTSYIYPNLNERISNNNGILVMDYKGKEHNAVKVFANRHDRLNDVVEIGKPWGESINIIKYMSEANLEDFIVGILGLNDGKNDYWSSAGTNLGIACLNIIGKLENLINDMNKLDNKDSIIYNCFRTNLKDDNPDLGYLKGIPIVKNLKSLYEITASTDSMKLFASNIDTLCCHIEEGIGNTIFYDDVDMELDDIDIKYKNILESFCLLEDSIKKYYPVLETFVKDKSNNNFTSILTAVNKPLASYATKDYLNGDNFDVIEALNNSKIVVINTQELSEEILSNYCYSIFKELQKRVTKNKVCDVSIFIDEAQRVVSKYFDLPIDVLREAKVELFLSYQNEDLMIEKLGVSKYQSLYKNIAHRYLFKNNEIGLSNLKTFEYKDLSKNDIHKIRLSKPIFLNDIELFDVEKEYQDNLKLHSKYGIKEEYKNSIILSDISQFEKYQLILKDKDNNNFIVNIEKGIDKDRYNKLFEKVCLAKEGLDSVSTKYNEKKTNQNLLYYNRQVV